MPRRWKVTVEQESGVWVKPQPGSHTLRIEGLTQAQVAFIRCMLQADYEVDPIEDWGFKKKDGDLQAFRMNVANDLEKKGY